MVTRDAVTARTYQRQGPRPRRTHVLVGRFVAGSALVIGIGGGPAGALDRIPGPWHPHGAETQLRVDDHGERQSDWCSAAAAPVATTADPAVATSSLTQTVTVVVPPIVRVLAVDDGMSVVTNAARPPAPGDQVYLLGADGDYSPADQALVARVMSVTWADASWCDTTAEHRSVG